VKTWPIFGQNQFRIFRFSFVGSLTVAL